MVSVEEDSKNSPFEWKDDDISCTEESDASSIVKTVKRRPKPSSKNSAATS
jgi:hypothetical protein